MRNDNLAAALRARHRQLVRLVLKNTEDHFYDLFPDWWSSHTACMTADEILETVRFLAPKIATRIDAKNAEFEVLAAHEASGALSVSERDAYLGDDLRVPHLEPIPKFASFSGNGQLWKVVNPADLQSRIGFEGTLVRHCPGGEEPSPAPYIMDCFGYVNFNLDSTLGKPHAFGHRTPTVLGREVYRNLQAHGTAIEFVLQMIEDQSAQVALKTWAEQVVSSLPASEVPVGSVGRRVATEFERLQCKN